MRCLIILSLASTVLSGSPLHRRHGSIKARRIEERAVEALDFDAAGIFPPPLLEKRGLVGLLGDVVGAVTTVVSDLLVPTTTTATPTSTAASSSNAQGETATQSTAVTNSPNTSASASPSPTPSAGAGTTNPPTGNSSAGGSGGASNGAIGGTNNSFHAIITPQVVTDHEGNTLTLTGPVTRTWVTTFPNGVVSTVTEVLTPTVDVAGAEPPISMAPGKIAAIVGTIVTVFLVIFAAFVFLMMRKRQKRRIGLLDSRPDSIASFGSVSDEFNSERRMSNAAAVPNTSISSFLTAPAHVDGMQMDFPLPPVPAVESRPVSSLSDVTFDFSQYRMSRGSIIEDRNRFRKIGQYPDVDSYTPFVLPPSEFGHSEEASGATPRVSIVADNDRSLGASSSGSNLTGGNPVLLGTENPFVDPVTVPQAIHMTTGNGNPLVNSAARRSTLWRTSTFGPTSYTPPARRPSRVASISRNTMASMASSEYDTALDHVDDGTSSNGPPSRHPSTSTSHFSYHSAFEAYAQSASLQAPAPENPFVDQPLPTVPTNMPPPRLTYPALRPNTATSSGATSAVSSVGNGSRELGGTPDPNDLFYRNSTERSQALGGRISEESRARSDAGTVRGTHVAYPALRDSSTARGTSS